MLDGSKMVAFLATTDAARARAFYDGVLRMAFVSEDDFAIVYDGQETELRIQKVEQLTPQPHKVLGGSVASVDREVREVSGRGGIFERYPFLTQDGSGVWTSLSGPRVAWLKDPDGNLLSFTEKPSI